MADRIVVLTGGIGSGKSLVASLFAKKGVVIVDADAISHRLTGPMGAAMPAISQALGPEVVAENGGLDRATVREKAFADPGLRKTLEAILHPMIRQEALVELQAAQGPYAMYMVPLWAERYGRYRPNGSPNANPNPGTALLDQDPGFSPLAVVVVDCDEDTQIQRVKDRSGLAEDQIRRIMAAQVSRQERLNVADKVLTNNGSLASIQAQVDALHQQLIHT